MARVLLVHQPVDGGVGRHVSDLARGLHGAGHEVVVCGPAPPPLHASSIRHVPLSLERAISTADARAARRLSRLVGEIAPDVIHAHSSKAGAVARLARVGHPRVPIVYSPHGYAFAGHFERRIERVAYRAVERALSPLASRVICVCEAEARLARTIGPRDRVRVVYNGVPAPPRTPPADPQMASLRHAGPVICTLTQLRPGKGLEALLDAMPELLRHHPSAQLVIWGDGPERQSLRTRAEALRITESVALPGATDDPLAVLAGADVFVLPSLAEAFPYVVLEAMSIGRPIIASDVGGIREALDDGEAGTLVPPADPPALARAIGSLLSDPGRAQRLANAARERVAGAFTIPRMVLRTAQVYEELTAAAASREGRPRTDQS